ncbi:hypothetical protein AMJ74_04565 [candidate division WOR_3 bacterium SM1_77]|jgi:hypothetical protein|uniref:Uncharacterized protein n=1 Tax=candidate division WOR_3 bacterium SM1_77 TaxID=1703778 RepID=A0A0S8JZ24_UNCW3|nr:MAG: hypothetical protein AMJ74_04565 [candidate division WOR_3 bacterium SM1_77]
MVHSQSFRALQDRAISSIDQNKEVIMRRIRTRLLIACLIFGFIGTIQAADRVVLLEEAYWSG